jgi:hypothetical protein
MGDHHLTAVRDFGPYRCGDHIEDPAEVARILGGELAPHVIKVPADRKPAPAAAATESDAAEIAAG